MYPGPGSCGPRLEPNCGVGLEKPQRVPVLGMAPWQPAHLARRQRGSRQEKVWWWLELLATREQQNPVRECQSSGSTPQPRQLPTEGAEHKELLERWVVERRFLPRGRAGAWEAGDPDGCPVTLNRRSLLSLSHLLSIITNLTKPCDLPTAGRLVLLQERGL